MKVAILGSDGFIGKNLFEDLPEGFDTYGSSRRIENQNSKGVFYFDLKKVDTWGNLIELKPDCIINCIVSGAIKKDEDVKEAIDFNYLLTLNFYDYIKGELPNVYLIHFGTAFEYNLDAASLMEETKCLPKTYYGISKYLISKVLLEGQSIRNFTIIRPFNLFGPYDQETRIISYLITAQKEKKPAVLSGGEQKRDYLFVKDLSNLVSKLIGNTENRENRIINAGSGEIYSVKEMADILIRKFPAFDETLWQWGKLPYRRGESPVFYNGSMLAKKCGMILTNIDLALEKTVNCFFSPNYFKTDIK